MECLRVLELYSGIGGMHYALKDSGLTAEVVAAVDVNTTANQIYKHNFPSTTLWSKTIEGITLNEFDKLGFDMILMSPPCQPFTRIGLQGDVSDPRAKSFLYILDLLPRLKKLPRFILLENVKGFETSNARDALLKTLQVCGYSFQEFLLSPTCLGIPNSRLRYFLLAKAPPDSFTFQTSSEILESFPSSSGNGASSETSTVPDRPPECASSTNGDDGGVSSTNGDDGGVSSTNGDGGGVLYKLETAQDAQRKMGQNRDESVRRIQEFLEVQREGGGEDMERYLLPPKTLLRYAILMDIVRPSCRRSVCFTKGYGHYVEGTGSVLQSCVEEDMEEAFRSLELQPEEDKLRRLEKLKLRYFTPREIANLMGFPADFTFPEDLSVKQRYRVLGNSLNVHVVARLIKLMLP